MDYIPTPGPHEGDLYIPSNGTEGGEFLDAWCGNCARDKAMSEGAELDECDDNQVCPIIAASFRGEAVEWRELSDRSVKCIAFVQVGYPIPAAKCERTADLFL